MNIYRRRGEDKDESLVDFTAVGKGIDGAYTTHFYALCTFELDLIYVHAFYFSLFKLLPSFDKVTGCLHSTYYFLE